MIASLSDIEEQALKSLLADKELSLFAQHQIQKRLVQIEKTKTKILKTPKKKK